MDGVLVWNPNKEPEPAHDAPPDVLWAWADKQKALETSTIRFLPFDVKYLSLLPAGRHKHNYAFVVPAKSHQTEKAQVYFIRFETEPDGVAIVPKVTFDHSTHLPYGIQPLIAGMPLWAYLFMVH